MSKWTVRAACLAAMLFFTYTFVADYLAYNVTSSVTQAIDTWMPLMSFCVANATIDQATFDSFKSDKHRVTRSRHTKTIKYLDAAPSVLQCVAVNATNDDGHVRLHFKVPQTFKRLLWFMTDTLPAGNAPVTAWLEWHAQNNVQFRRYVVGRLPHPFVTDCKRSDQFACVDRCADDLATCLTKCRHLACRQTTYVIEKLQTDIIRNTLTLVDARSSDVVTITYVPQFDLPKLLIYLASLVNAFFGVSFWNAHRLISWSARRIRCGISYSKAAQLVVKLLVQLVAIGCCVWQTVPVTKDYFTYATQTEMYMGKMHTAIAVVPDVSLCQTPSKIGSLNHASFYKAASRNVSGILNSITVATYDGESQITAEQLQLRRLVTRYTVTIPGLFRFPCFMLHLAAAGTAHTFAHRGIGQMALFDFKKVARTSVSLQCQPDVVIDLSNSGTTSSMRRADRKWPGSRMCFAGSWCRTQRWSMPLSTSSTTNCCRRHLPPDVATINANHVTSITGAAS